MKNICDWSKCNKIGLYRAPIEKDNSKKFRLLCLEHIKEFNKNIKDNVKDTGNTIGTALSKIENDIANIGLKSKSGVMDEQTKQLTLNRLDALLQSPSDIKRAMMSKYGYSNTSFFDDIKKPSTLSASLYSTLMNATGKTKDGEILPQGILEGVKDTDGSGGISKAELQDAKNYMVLSVI